MRVLATVAAVAAVLAAGVDLAPTPTQARTAEPLRAPTPARAEPRLPYWRTCRTGYRCARQVLPHFFKDWRYALSIVKCETGGTYSNYVVGAAGELSWWQIHPVHFGWANPRRLRTNPRYATSVAYRLSRGGRDWSPWTCA
jgi:hypothetical protein